jgi:predicted small integral membrane protein
VEVYRLHTSHDDLLFWALLTSGYSGLNRLGKLVTRQAFSAIDL